MFADHYVTSERLFGAFLCFLLGGALDAHIEFNALADIEFLTCAVGFAELPADEIGIHGRKIVLFHGSEVNATFQTGWTRYHPHSSTLLEGFGFAVILLNKTETVKPDGNPATAER